MQSKKSERTLILLKPQAIQRKLFGRIIARFEDKNLNIVAARLLLATKEQIEAHYAEHKGSSFFEEIVTYLCEGEIFITCLEGPRAIHIVRKLIGSTWPHDAQPGTIRGDFAIDLPDNLIHGSADERSAEYELRLWFPELFT